ncbi:hypothetical protein C8F04DRAFT_670823 [Mycena alexandri]|uniref:C2H2-type domain-containing protein n=1 Tax=Mycena alexandri TaxID=1745969 RepID=A0AAD6SQX0_9AGAR|nr:hypothetical protein C8F04DRAFT_670823 [Mycena alexandri]
MYPHNSPTSSPMALQHDYSGTASEIFRDQSMEPYPALPMTYPESSQRTRVQQVQFREMPTEAMSMHKTYVRRRDLPSAPAFSPPPIPSDRPPPSLRLPSFPNASFSYSPTSQDMHPSSSSHRQGVGGSHLSLSLPLSSDGEGDQRPSSTEPVEFHSHSTQIYSGFVAGRDFDPSYDPTSSPDSLSELDPPSPISIETIPSHVERREGRRRKGPDKMHACELCKKEFPRPSALRTHMNVHNNAKPHKCGFPNCSKTFSVLSNARRHYRTHGEKLPAPGPPSDLELTWTASIDAPQQPAGPSAGPSQARFNVRWVPNGRASLSKAAPPPKQSKSRPTANDFNEQQAPIHLYDPFPTVQPSSTQVYDTPQEGSWRTHHPE